MEDQIKKQEQNWAQATVKEGAAAVDQYEADDIIDTDPSGRVTDKAQDKTDLSSGDLKFQSIEPASVAHKGKLHQHESRYYGRGTWGMEQSGR